MTTVLRLDTRSDRPGAPKRHAVEVAPDREPWHRQPTETPLAFDLFVVFRDLGPDRTLAKVAEATGRTLTSVSKWSARHGWPARVKAWNAATASDHEQRMGERQRTVLDRQFSDGARIEAAAVELLVEQIASGQIYGKDAVPLLLGIRADQRKVVGHTDARTGAGPAVVVNVGTPMPAYDARLSEFATRIAAWASYADLAPEQMAGLTAAIQAVERA